MRLVFPSAADLETRSPHSIFQGIADSLFAVVFPTPCSLCARELSEAGGLDICRSCWASLEPWRGAICARCGLPFASERALDSSLELCSLCRQEDDGFDRARSYGLYTGKLRAAILQLKFRRRERLGARLGALLASTWVSLEDSREPAVVVPVPLHNSRLRERGFNQAELLARGLCAGLQTTRQSAGAGIETRCLRRTRATRPQTGLSVRARRENVRGVFDVTRPERVRGRAVVLVDDVMTTGATLSACAATLKRAGAARVLALTLARATPEFPDLVPVAPAAPVDDSGRDWT